MGIVRKYKIGNTTIIDHDDFIENEEQARERLRNIARIVAQDAVAAKIKAQRQAETEVQHNVPRLVP